MLPVGLLCLTVTEVDGPHCQADVLEGSWVFEENKSEVAFVQQIFNYTVRLPQFMDVYKNRSEL